jgi:[protein-PII] uridylyltransferase
MMPSEPQASTPPASSASSLRDELGHAREELVERTRTASGGIPAVRRYSDRLDALLRRIHDGACDLTQTPHALVAVGGYGRKQMSMYSDVDLLVVFDGSVGAAEERFLKSMLHPLWDLRLDVGHHIRELEDASTVDTDNPKYLVALLDARFLDGDRTVFDRFSTACLQRGTPWEAATMEVLRELTRQRHTQFNHTLYHLEPDLKDAPGGLRDVAAARKLTRLQDPDRPPAFEAGRLAEAEDFMLRIRSVLHLERGRNLNVLTHELQETAASVFGLGDEDPRRRVETLMSTYFHHARIISRALATTVGSLEPKPRDSPTAIGENLVRWGNEISFADGTRASLQPATWLRAFEGAIDEHCAASSQVLTCIERHGDRYSPERFFSTDEDRDRLLHILHPRPGLYARLSEMHDSGLLGHMFPEFQKIYCLVIRDFYHKYTVDEHTLRAIRNLELLCTPSTRSQTRFENLLGEVQAPALLVLALLFHDVGKWTNKNHSEEGVRMALGALRRIRLPESDIATVVFLIRHHLRMSTTAFRRDAEDPDVVEQFARLVSTEERLKMLCLLTLADVAAVGPDVMSPWKEELLWQLYVDTYNRLTRGYGDDVIDPAVASLTELQSHRPDDLAVRDVEAFLDGLPQRYLRLVDHARVYEHIRLSRDLDPTHVQCTLEQKNSAWELTVVSIDQPKLYAKICGVLSFYGMDILRGQAMSNHHGVALDIFQFTDAESFFRLNLSGPDEFIRRLREVVAGQADIDAILRPKELGLVRRTPNRVRVVVHVDNQYSDRFSILEIVTHNAWGLLYRISRAISHCGCDIDLVLASTEGSRAIDVFHLTKNGAKLSTDDLMALRQTLERLLDETNETH